MSVSAFEDVPPLYARIADLPLDKPAKVAYLRGGERKETDVTVTEMEKFLGEERVVQRLGHRARWRSPRRWPGRAATPTRRASSSPSARPGYPAEVAKPSPRGRRRDPRAVGGEPVTDERVVRGARQEARGQEGAAACASAAASTTWSRCSTSRRSPRRAAAKELPRAWLGVQTQVLTPTVAEALGLKGTQGFRVARVLPGTQAEKAGFKPGDVITHLDGDALKASQAAGRRDPAAQDRGHGHRRRREAEGRAAASPRSRSRSPSRRRRTPRPTPRRQGRGARVRGARDDLHGLRRARPPRADGEGRLQCSCGRRDEPAAGPTWTGLQGGDLLLSIQDQPTIRSIQDFDEAVKSIAAEARPKRVKIFVRRDRITAFVFVQPDWPAK